MAGPTALMRHVMYFDPSGTGRVTIGQTYQGLLDLGVTPGWCGVLSGIINVALGSVTSGRPTLTIEIENIERGVHASDTGVFNKDGTLNRERLEAVLDRVSGSSMTEKELRHVQTSEGEQGSFGNFFSFAEARLFFCVARDGEKQEDGQTVPSVSKRRMRLFYEGKLLPALRRKRRIDARRNGRFGQ